MHRLLAILLAAVPAAAQLPEFYRTVDRVVWVVGDADRVTEGWSKTGLPKVQKRGGSTANVARRSFWKMRKPHVLRLFGVCERHNPPPRGISPARPQQDLRPPPSTSMPRQIVYSTSAILT
jgi:hypothetical protein